MAEDDSPERLMVKQEEEFQLLLQGVAARSEEAVRRFVDTYGHMLVRVIRKRLMPKLRKQFDSADFLQDVYASFLCKPIQPEAFADAKALLAFLTTMARNKVIDVLRRGQRQKCDVRREFSLDGSARVQADEVAQADPSPSKVVGAKDVVQKLPDVQQQILRLLREGYPPKAVAERLGLHPKWIQRITAKIHAKVSS